MDQDTLEALDEFGDVASRHLDEITNMLEPGANLALAIWYNGKMERQLLLLSPGSTIEDAIAALERLRLERDNSLKSYN